MGAAGFLPSHGPAASHASQKRTGASLSLDQETQALMAVDHPNFPDLHLDKDGDLYSSQDGELDKTCRWMCLSSMQGFGVAFLILTCDYYH
jgi:hypothetical protein